MPDLEALYLKLPVALQHLACSVEGLRIQRTRFNGAFASALARAEARAAWSEDKTRAFRDGRLRAFVRHAAESVPFYRQRFREAGVAPEDIRTVDDLQRLPVLTKAEVQEHADALISEAVPRSARSIAHTSGTTGAGLRFAITREATQEQWAVWWRYRRWHGLEQGRWCGFFGGRSVVPLYRSAPPFWRYNIPGRQILFSGYHISPETIPHYIAELRRRRPRWLHGYPSLLSLLAGHILDSGEPLHYRPRWITIGAENLLPQQARLIERGLGTRPIQHYGMAEGVANISECELGSLHVDEDYAAVEFLPRADGPGHRIIGTNFTNPATPLLRYDSGDLAELTDAVCGCSRPGRIVARIDGRREDYVLLGNGARIGRMDHVFKDMTRIKEAQIHQVRPGELTLRVVRGEGYSERDESALLAEAHKRVGEETAVRIAYLDRLPRSRSGKLRLVVSEIPDAGVASS